MGYHWKSSSCIAIRLSRLVVLVAGLTACGRRDAMRIQFAADTLEINTRIPAAAGVTGLDDRGQPVTNTMLAYSVSPAAIMKVSNDGMITCSRTGRGHLVVTSGTTMARAPVWCHLIKRFGVPAFVQLVLGGKPQPVQITAYDDSGNFMPHVRAPMLITDTSVVRFTDGMLTGLKIGMARVAFDSRWEPAINADSRMPELIALSIITVSEQIADSQAVTIANGDSVTWPLRTGMYRTEMQFEQGPGLAPGVRVSWKGTFCQDVPPDSRRVLVCTVRPEARNPRLVLTNSASGPARGVVSLLRNEYRP
ncbi:MAG: hypothetical protein JWM95_4685 [Gemmatimonadetes bacterium]|nr:hypothetical protein [Gemmatimonadota bacterium]